MSFRAGNKHAIRLYQKDEEGLIDFVLRVLGEGFNVQPNSVIVRTKDQTKAFIATPEQAETEGLTGVSVGDALHVRMQGNKSLDLQDVLRKAKQQESGVGNTTYEFKPGAVKQAQDDYKKLKAEYDGAEDNEDIKAKALAEVESKRLNRPTVKIGSSKPSDEDDKDDEKDDLGYEPKKDNKFANRSEDRKQEQDNEDEKPKRREYREERSYDRSDRKPYQGNRKPWDRKN